MNNKRIIFLLLLFLAVAFTACESEQEQIAIEVELDNSGLLAAVRDANQSLAGKMTLIENALNDGLADNREAMRLIQEVIASLGGTVEQKMKAIEGAVKTQTLSLEAKLALVEAAVAGGFADSQSQQKLLEEAVASLEGTMEEKLARIETAMKAPQASLETKIGLIQAAATDGFADSATAHALIAEAIEAAGTTLVDKMAAVEAAIGSQTTDLVARLALIETAVKEGFAEDTTGRTLIRTAIDSLSGTMETKFAALEAAVKSQTTSLETKLKLVTESAQFGSADNSWGLELLRRALASLNGTLSDKLDAIQEAVASETTDLETKIGLIATALKEGFFADTAAVHAMQKALDTSLQGLDADLTAAKSAVIGQLTDIAAELTPQKLAEALQLIKDAIAQAQTPAAKLAAIEKTIGDVKEAVGVDFKTMTGLIYMGAPGLPDTVSCGKSVTIRLCVNPSTVKLTKDMLEMDQTTYRNQFFLVGTDRSQAVTDHFSITSLEPDLQKEGQYFVVVKTSEAGDYPYWDETSLVFTCKTTDANGHPQTFSTQPIPVVVLPNPMKGLSISGRENTASFLMRDTLGIIYQPLVSVAFENESKEKRTYTAEFLESAQFDPTSQLKVTALLDREKHFVGLEPDTTDLNWRSLDYGWGPLFDSTHVSHHEILGTLNLTDRWGGTCSPSLTGLAWYTSYADTVLADPSIDQDGKLLANLSSKATALGLNLGEHPGSTYCSVTFDYASASGAWLSAGFKEDSWDLEMQLMTYPTGSRFTVDAVISQTVEPNEKDKAFRPKQRMARIRVTFTVPAPKTKN